MYFNFPRGRVTGIGVVILLAALTSFSRPAQSAPQTWTCLEVKGTSIPADTGAIPEIAGFGGEQAYDILLAGNATSGNLVAKLWLGSGRQRAPLGEPFSTELTRTDSPGLYQATLRLDLPEIDRETSALLRLYSRPDESSLEAVAVERGVVQLRLYPKNHFKKQIQHHLEEARLQIYIAGQSGDLRDFLEALGFDWQPYDLERPPALPANAIVIGEQLQAAKTPELNRPALWFVPGQTEAFLLAFNGPGPFLIAPQRAPEKWSQSASAQRLLLKLLTSTRSSP